MKKIYIHTSDAAKKAALENICKTLKIEMHKLKGSDLNRTVAAICGVSVGKSGAHTAAPALYALPEILLFFGIDDSSLDSFLEAYNATGLESIKRKAVITPVNLNWTLYELAEALGKECQ